jgi:lysozyme family protein
MSAWSNALDGLQANPTPVPENLSAAFQIFLFERDLDTRGHLEIAIDPPDDGGIREVAGITLRYDGPEEVKLEAMVNAGEYAQAQSEAVDYIQSETNCVTDWCQHPAIEANLRDIQFNRGSGGCMKILQKSLGVTVDGDFGPITEATEKAAEAEPGAFLDDLYQARVWYEDTVVGVRANLNAGLMNRFAQARDFAKTFIDTPDMAVV